MKTIVQPPTPQPFSSTRSMTSNKVGFFTFNWEKGYSIWYSTAWYRYYYRDWFLMHENTIILNYRNKDYCHTNPSLVVWKIGINIVTFSIINFFLWNNCPCYITLTMAETVWVPYRLRVNYVPVRYRYCFGTVTHTIVCIWCRPIRENKDCKTKWQLHSIYSKQ